jgi:adenine deaminase
MLPPSEFARQAVVHGTVGTVSDPHEIANVLGSAGVQYMLDNAAIVPLKICFGAPSCVPATPAETAGATLSADDIELLFGDKRIGYLSEMMNYPGVLNNDDIVMRKIGIAQHHGRPIDGHGPGLRGDDARRYIEAGISADHECFILDKALDKL